MSDESPHKDIMEWAGCKYGFPPGSLIFMSGRGNKAVMWETKQMGRHVDVIEHEINQPKRVLRDMDPGYVNTIRMLLTQSNPKSVLN